MLELHDSVASIPGVGEASVKKLEKLDIRSVSDLLNHFPFRYEDFSHITPINKLAPDRTACIKASILSFENNRTRSRLTLQKALVEDESGQIQLAWFNQPFLGNTLKVGESFFFTGPITQFRGKLSLTSPDYEPIKEIPIHTARIVPIYPETRGINSRWLRHKIFMTLRNLSIPDPIQKIITQTELIQLDQAYRQIHFPDTLATQQKAEKRLAFNDLLGIYLKSALTKHHWRNKKALSIKVQETLHQKFLKSLDFDLTSDQHQALENIFKDITGKCPMNRLVQGDVGSGKTILAIAAALQTAKQGIQTIILAPTQVLASQHYLNFQKLLQPFDIVPNLITGDIKKRDSSLVLIGTHALLHSPQIIDKEKLGLLIIDEQHRFGVFQRSHFLQGDFSPHILTMSATPIPRTIALSIYGHLDISNIKTMPKGRLPIKTWVVPETKRENSYTWIKQQLDKGQQAFIVCPFIDASLSDSLKNVKAAIKEYEHLQKNVFANHKLVLLHGRLKPSQKDQILSDFKEKKYDILVTTPVIEVGVDIPSATIMVIEDASRFGLSQLHQLRGRVGRGDQQAFCLLFTGESDSISRLKLLEKHDSGLELAKLDLKLRGSGDLFGSAQSGHIDTQFDLFWNKELNSMSSSIADAIVSKDAHEGDQILQLLNDSLAKYASDN